MSETLKPKSSKTLSTFKNSLACFAASHFMTQQPARGLKAHLRQQCDERVRVIDTATELVLRKTFKSETKSDQAVLLLRAKPRFRCNSPLP